VHERHDVQPRASPIKVGLILPLITPSYLHSFAPPPAARRKAQRQPLTEFSVGNTGVFLQQLKNRQVGLVETDALDDFFCMTPILNKNARLITNQEQSKESAGQPEQNICTGSH
jgi:hypothetical protein